MKFSIIAALVLQAVIAIAAPVELVKDAMMREYCWLSRIGWVDRCLEYLAGFIQSLIYYLTMERESWMLVSLH
ncbi:hypothetical protein V8E51_011205 [Hyaloscypha variabilis]